MMTTDYRSPNEYRRVTVDGREYVVSPTPLAKSWAVRFCTYVAGGPDESGRGLFGDGLTYYFAWDSPESFACAPTRDAQSALSIRGIEAAYPEVHARGTKTIRVDGGLTGAVEITVCPREVEWALRWMDVEPTDMASTAERLTHRLGGTVFPKGIEHPARVLAAALAKGDVDEQVRWATWIVNPAAAAEAEVRRINRAGA